MPSRVILHDYWRSTASYRVRIALNLAGIGYTSVPVDLVAGDQTGPDHLAINPQALVPVLEIDGIRLTQSLAILDYLEETGRLSLKPADAASAAHMRAISQAVACDIHPVCNLRVVAHVQELTGKPKARQEWMQRFIRPGLVAVESLLSRHEGPYGVGRDLTQADVVLIPQLYNASRWNVPFDDLPRIQAVYDNCVDLPAFSAAHPDAVAPAP